MSLCVDNSWCNKNELPNSTEGKDGNDYCETPPTPIQILWPDCGRVGGEPGERRISILEMIAKDREITEAGLKALAQELVESRDSLEDSDLQQRFSPSSQLIIRPPPSSLGSSLSRTASAASTPKKSIQCNGYGGSELVLRVDSQQSSKDSNYVVGDEESLFSTPVQTPRLFRHEIGLSHGGERERNNLSEISSSVQLQQEKMTVTPRKRRRKSSCDNVQEEDLGPQPKCNHHSAKKKKEKADQAMGKFDGEPRSKLAIKFFCYSITFTP